MFEEFLIFGKDSVINEDTGKGVEGGIMKLGFSQGSSVPVGPLFVFGEFAVEKLEAQK